MKRNPLVGRLALGLYLLIFFGYLLGPLVVMSLTAFNSAQFPSVSPWACFTFEWFGVLFRDERILESIRNSFIIGFGTVILSVSIGLAAALILSQITAKLRGIYYTIIIAPILIPGVVLGISTLVFWDRLSRLLGASTEGLFHNGIFLTVIGQAAFISSYTMLVFVARLQRFDPLQTEAALDLGATHMQAFRKVLLPFLRPAIASAAVLAFLASFENYNTTTFLFGQFPTLTIELAQMVRYGINPSISALAFIIVVLTVFGGLAAEALRRARFNRGPGLGAEFVRARRSILPVALRGNIAALGIVLLSFVVIAGFVTAQSYSPAQCKAMVLKVKKERTELRIKELQERMAERAAAAAAAKKTAEDAEDKATKPANNSGAFGNVFGQDSLGKVGADDNAAPSDQGSDSGGANNSGAFGNVFDPGNLDDVGGKKNEPATEPGNDPESDNNSGAFGNVFDPGNLGKVGGKDN
ncbi:ABC transporter permease [Aquicoccus sp. G2-2]|uniref:ABC transporter permease n=1 Tax=Aquicoccus sp. G2-2 TaxID=3092120 RepID=UPI002AE0397F|nr:ABC transporter permease [Aquicoccus sp. G2-2]MEA1112303.1 ABC transporter permease [Aquicoccus sp. G2-2]